MFKKNVKLSIDKAEKCFIGGEPVTGTVSLDLKEAVKVTEIYIKIRGHGKVSWTMLKNPSQGGATPSKSRTVSAETDIIKEQISVWKPEGGKKLSASPHRFQWCFELAESIPSSFKNNNGLVNYYAKVVVDRPWALDWEDEESFVVVESCDLRKFSQAHEEVERYGHASPGYWLLFRRPIDIKIHLPSHGLIINEKIPIKVEINNKSKRNLSFTQLKLRQMCTLTVGTNFQASSRIVFKHKEGTVAAGETATWDNVNLTLPYIPASGGSWPSIQFAYTFEFIAKVSFGQKIFLEWPAIVGTSMLTPNPVPEMYYPPVNLSPYPPEVVSPYPPEAVSPYPPDGASPYPSDGAPPYPPDATSPYPPDSQSDNIPAQPYPPPYPHSEEPEASPLPEKMSLQPETAMPMPQQHDQASIKMPQPDLAIDQASSNEPSAPATSE